jgi:elongator complex protein 3
MPPDYQREFAKSCFEALNGHRAIDLESAKVENQKAQNRCVGFTVETKPDYCKQDHIDLMLELGVTRVEIGVQSLGNEVYRLVNRGHTLEDVKSAFASARESGLKIVAHMMPGLPGSSLEKDIEDFRRLFQDDEFKPDMLKIYPTLVLQNTGLYELHKRGSYRPYSDSDLLHVMVEAKKLVPPWVRIMRVQREIESDNIIAGPKSGNLRQLVLKELRSQGFTCKCIRCREAGLQGKYPADSDVVLQRLDYSASRSREIFLSFESRDGSIILGFLRLRLVNEVHRHELAKSAIVRELHVYGQVVGIGLHHDDDATESMQHRGYGSKLLREAERISREEFGLQKIAITSAVGTREYYKRFGYAQDGPYMSKVLA